jgi:hypothetical protein
VSNGWLSARLRMGKPASASQFVRHFLLKPNIPDVLADTLEEREVALI